MHVPGANVKYIPALLVRLSTALDKKIRGEWLVTEQAFHLATPHDVTVESWSISNEQSQTAEEPKEPQNGC